MKRVAVLVGTRPEVIKLAPLISELRTRKRFDVDLICTGQHQDILEPLVKFFNLKINHVINLKRKSDDLNDLFTKLMDALGGLFSQDCYDLVIAQGDTTSVLAAGLCAFHLKIPFAHIEAGLRSRNILSPFPEEMNRLLVSRLAKFHFAPTEEAVSNLIREGVDRNSVYMVGNTVIDALKMCVSQLSLKTEINAKRKILVTIHRRENHGDRLLQICSALKSLACRQDIEIVLPVHPNPNVKRVVESHLGGHSNIRLCPPLSYPELVREMVDCYFVVTDSGGIQEEAPYLLKPILILRDETERPEIVHLKGARLVGAEPALILSNAEELLDIREKYNEMIIGYSPFGRGDSSAQICNILEKCLL